ncbi:MAG: hypothetical protein JHD07_25275 [Bradyrhizobium sp.]|nr:hypothetical protein [Bradyrhizobium sp.]MBJ7406433.1 hypothetical protein [Bradyrhizobium sp.]
MRHRSTVAPYTCCSQRSRCHGANGTTAPPRRDYRTANTAILLASVVVFV